MREESERERKRDRDRAREFKLLQIMYYQIYTSCVLILPEVNKESKVNEAYTHNCTYFKYLHAGAGIFSSRSSSVRQLRHSNVIYLYVLGYPHGTERKKHEIHSNSRSRCHRNDSMRLSGIHFSFT